MATPFDPAGVPQPETLDGFPWPVTVKYVNVYDAIERDQPVEALWQLRDAWEGVPPDAVPYAVMPTFKATAQGSRIALAFRHLSFT